MLLYLIKEFIIIGCLALGGGLVVVPFIQNIASITGWITDSQIIEMITISEIIPGPLPVNMATYIGYIVTGIPGGILVTLALISPQIIITFLIYKAFAKFKDDKNVIIILKGIRPVSLALAASGALVILESIFLQLDNYSGIDSVFDIFNWKCILLGIILIIAMRKLKLHPAVYFIICALIGILLNLT